ncbi:MAG TPA: cysteine hydrolase family protein [Symbiobacteriaceae bacterium]|nr:cysteine hydrolase family protein [Symbiobacteriaceae bacterium]
MSELALLVIDAQVGVLAGDHPCVNVPKVLANIRGLQARAREAGIPVMFVQDDSLLEEGEEAWQIHPAIAPLPGELVVRKTACDSFCGTNLHEELQARGIRRLIVAGAQTEYCVDSAVRRATAQGYHVTLVSDAHTTTDTEVLSGEQIIAHANRTFAGFANLAYSVTVRPAAEITFAAVR